MQDHFVIDILNKIPPETLNKQREDLTQFISQVSEEHPFSIKRLGEILIAQKKITPEALDAALSEQKQSQKKLGTILVQNNLITSSELSKSLATQLNLEYLEKIPYQEIDPSLVKDLNISFCLQNGIVPISEDKDSFTVAISDPLETSALNDIRILLGKHVRQIVSSREMIDITVNNLFERMELGQQSKELHEEDDDGSIAGLDDVQDLLLDNEEAPVRKEVSTIIRRGIIEKASDIHIEPYDDRVVVRFRVDGVLREVRTIPKKYQSSVTTRIKILSKLNIAESRIPQDGRISLKVGARDIDLRVSTLPIKYGERIVLRILDKSGGLPELSKLGLPPYIYHNFETLIKQKHGIVLVTGPTGSGKTTTLAASIMHINKPDISIITVEDPVEIQLPGVSQVEFNEKAGLTFAAALRSILRQNPNVMLIGEIRDAETAQIAVQASMTGHLVFSTLHTNDTASSVTRLVDFGVEPFQITTTVLGILAVRLMRKLCSQCKEVYDYSPQELKLLGLSPKDTQGKTLYRVKNAGCPTCKSTGYSGRIGIYELMIFDDPIRNFILKSADGASLKKLCMKNGMQTLRDSAVIRFLNGETSLQEAIAVTQVETTEEVPPLPSA
jgi:general secretion pathway protein E